MKPSALLCLVCLPLIAGCATVTASSTQDITVTTTPAGASCSLHNALGTWVIEETPGTASVARSVTPLHVRCDHEKTSTHATIASKTRGRAYGNILLFGLPAFVDAATGAGYGYEQDVVTLNLSKE